MRETFHRRIRGIEIFERRAGPEQGPQTVVLHGGPGAHHDYLLPAVDALATGRTLVYYDQRGGGRSAVPRTVPVGWVEHVEDLDALRVLWGIERLSILGYSWGGLLALLYSITHPSHVDRLALVSPAPVWRSARDEFERRFTDRNMAPALEAERRAIRESGLLEQDPETYRQRIFELSVAAYFFDPDRARDLTPFRVTARTQQEVWASLGDYDLRPRLAALELPAVVLHGDADPIPTDASRTLATILSAPFHLLERCGHVPYLEAFEEFVRVVDAFLSSTSGPASNG